MTLDKKILGIKTAKYLGYKLAVTNPEIKQAYIELKSLSKTAQRFVPFYEKSPSVAKSTIRFALDVLLDDDEKKRLSQENIIFGGKYSGNENVKNSRGIFNRTDLYILSAVEKGMKRGRVKGGQSSRDNKKGMFSMDEEDKKEATRKSVISRGFVDYSVVAKTDLGKLTVKDYIETSRSKLFSWEDISKNINTFWNYDTSSKLIESRYNEWASTKKLKYEPVRVKPRFSLEEKNFIIENHLEGHSNREIALSFEKRFERKVSTNIIYCRIRDWKENF